MINSVEQLRYQAYSYSYPHKTAYREFAEPKSLADVWKAERRDSLFLYLHIPFCEMRCGFCNLFTTSNPEVSLEKDYLRALARQARVVSSALGEFTFARLALGGGTPTFLDASDLERLFEVVESEFRIDPHSVPTSIETSPYTTDRANLEVLKRRGVERVSIGIQSFIESEVMAVGRSQKAEVVERALDLLNEFSFHTLNIDLMYGLPGQSEKTWLQSLKKTLHYAPQQIYLYPLYIRPLTGLGKRGTSVEDLRVQLYRQARDFLVDAGYTQVSMRMFERARSFEPSRPHYCCQDDGMVGLGCGARSYTSSLHYSMRYAVEQKPAKQIIQNFVNASDSSFEYADYGFILDTDEQKRRYLVQSLLQLEGLVFADYKCRFGSEVHDDFAEDLNKLIERGFVQSSPERMTLTVSGLEWSDRIGFELYSPNVLHCMSEYEAS